MGETKRLTVICEDSQLEKESCVPFSERTGYKEQSMETIVISADEEMYKRKQQAIRDAKGEYIVFVTAESRLSDGFFQDIEKAVSSGRDLYSCKLLRATDGKRFFEQMFQDYELDYVDVTIDYKKVLRGFLGTVIRKEKLAPYVSDAQGAGQLENGWAESVALTKILSETMEYGLIDAILDYDRDSMDFIPARERSNERAQFERIFANYYDRLLSMKEGAPDGFARYLDVLVTIDIYYKINHKEVPKGLEKEVLNEYLEQLPETVKKIDYGILAHEIHNVISVNQRTWLLQEFYLQSRHADTISNRKQLIFVNGDVVVRKASNIPVQIDLLQMEQDELIISGTFFTNVSCKSFRIVLFAKEDEFYENIVPCTCRVLTGEGEYTLGRLSAEKVRFTGKIRLQGDITQLSVRMTDGTAYAPLEIKIDEKTQAFRYCSSLKEYDGSLVTGREKRFIYFVKNTPQHFQEEYEKQMAKWQKTYPAEVIDRALESVEKYRKCHNLCARNRILLVTCKEELSKEQKQKLQQLKDVKILVTSRKHKVVEGFKNVDFGSKEHRFAYIYGKYEWNLLGKNEEYSPFKGKEGLYEGIRCAVHIIEQEDGLEIL